MLIVSKASVVSLVSVCLVVRSTSTVLQIMFVPGVLVPRLVPQKVIVLLVKIVCLVNVLPSVL